MPCAIDVGLPPDARSPPCMQALRLLRIGLTVRDLAAAVRFYTDALGFGCVAQARAADPAVVTLLGACAIRSTLLRRGEQILELAAFDPPGAGYPPGSRSNDLWFQHCALVTADIDTAYVRLNRYPHSAISRNGPQTLPDGSIAFKFRDPEGHPLELIQLPHPDAETAAGIDHSAIVVANVDRSVAFYADVLNMRVRARQVNWGSRSGQPGRPGRNAGGRRGPAPAHPAPHVELLAYRHPFGREAARRRPADIAASRLVFAVDHLADDLDHVVLRDGTRAAWMADPDGHALLLLEAARSNTGCSSWMIPTTSSACGDAVGNPGASRCRGRSIEVDERLQLLEFEFEVSRCNPVKQAPGFKTGHCAGHRLRRCAEIVCDIVPAHRKGQNSFALIEVSIMGGTIE